MLLGLRQTLNLLDNLLVLLALNSNSDRKATHDENCSDIMILGYGLQVRDVQSTSRFVKDLGEVLGHKSI